MGNSVLAYPIKATSGVRIASLVQRFSGEKTSCLMSICWAVSDLVVLSPGPRMA